nr:hypothetical protein [Tanacetum cinerariifolium]
YGAILPIELTTDEIRNSKAYKEYYACTTGEAAPKPKASAKNKKGDSASSTTPPTPTPTTTVVSAPRLSATAKEKQPAIAITPTEPIDVERTEAENSKLHSKGADKRRTSLNNVVPVQMKELVLNHGFEMYHLMIQRKNFHGTLPMMK